MKQIKLFLLASMLILLTACMLKDIDPEASTVTANPTSVVADGIAISTITVTVKDEKSKPVRNAIVSLTQDSGSSTIGDVTNHKDGTYTFTVKSTSVETVTYTATANGVIITQTADVTFTVVPLPANITIDNASLLKAIGSIIDSTPWTIDVQGRIDTNGLNITIPYTVVNAPVTLPAYSTTFSIDSAHTEDDEAGIIATFAWAEQSDLPVGSGTFIATITINDANASIPDNTYNAKKLDIQDDIAGVVTATFPYATDDTGGTGTLTLKIYPGIPDRMFGEADNTGDDTTHMFLYLPVINPATGQTWLSNNLGANYANINSPSFDIAQQAISSNDHNAYGSLFQWGRKADGHEIINWIDSITGIPVNATTNIRNDNPDHALFITTSTLPYDWRVTQNDTLWASESSLNNVCPIGYRLATRVEFEQEVSSWAYPFASYALSSVLALTHSGARNADGSVTNQVSYGHYWASTTDSIFAHGLYLYSTVSIASSYRVGGFPVRCIKD